MQSSSDQSCPLPRPPRQRSRHSAESAEILVLAKVKFCGMTRPQDAALAAEIGASYVGVVFAEGPRCVDSEKARRILDAAGDGVKRVGVFGTNDPEAIGTTADLARLDVVQLHADPLIADVAAIREKFRGEIWAAIRIVGSHIPADAELLFETPDAVVLDTRNERRPGGTGQAVPWSEPAGDLGRDRGSSAVGLAGGLQP